MCRFHVRSLNELPAARLACFLLLTLAVVPALHAEEAAPVKEVFGDEKISQTKDKDVGYGDDASFLTWHGYLNFEFVDKQGIPSTFDNHEFYLSTKATLHKNLSVTAEFEYEHNPGTLVLPIQAFADYTIARELTIRSGLFFTPMGIPRTYTLRGNRNRMIRQVGLTHDIMFENWSEVGINVFGQFKNGLFYDFAVGNGLNNSLATGDSWNTAARKDTNGNKAVHSRFGYNTTRLGHGSLNFGASLGTQKYDPLETKQLNFAGFDVRYLHRSGWRLQAEFMNRSGDSNDIDLAKGISADARGWYTQVSKRIMLRDERSYIEPVVQLDSVDLNRHVRGNNDLLTTGLGFVLSPLPHYLLKFEYDVVKERQGLPLKNNSLFAAVVVEF